MGINGRKFDAHPQSAPGDFYVVNNECVSCGAPHAVTPDLIGWADSTEGSHCIWKRQPVTSQEEDQAIEAVLVSEVACHRYAGEDPRILDRLDSIYCDSPQAARHNQFGESSNKVFVPNFSVLVSQASALNRFLAAVKAIFRD